MERNKNSCKKETKRMLQTNKEFMFLQQKQQINFPFSIKTQGVSTHVTHNSPPIKGLLIYF